MRDDGLLNYARAAEYLGIAKGTLQNYFYTKKISGYKSRAGIVFFKRVDLDAFAFHERKASSFEINERAESLLNGGS